MLRIVSLSCAAIAAAVFGITAPAPALAQQAQTAGIAADDLFLPDTVDFKGGPGKGVVLLVDVVQRAQSPGSQCPTDVDFTVIGGSHPDGPLFSQALGTARRDAIEVVLRGFGPSVRITSKYTAGIVNMVMINAQSAKDKEPPKLDTNSVPRKGTKVKAGDQIKVTMVARDDANLWQSGIKTIQLVAESEGGRLIASENYRPAPPGCSELPSERRVEATYMVPSNTPLIVRLAALAEDHVGLMDTDLGEFPTKGDWYGWVDWRIPTPGGRQWGRLDLTFDYDGQGNLEGQMVGDDQFEAHVKDCRTTTQTPSKLSAKLVGQYTPGRNTMSLRVTDPQIEQGQYSIDCVAVSGAPFGGGGPLGQPGLAQLLNSFTVRADGSVDASGESPVTPASSATTLHLKLKLNRTQN